MPLFLVQPHILPELLANAGTGYVIRDPDLDTNLVTRWLRAGAGRGVWTDAGEHSSPSDDSDGLSYMHRHCWLPFEMSIRRHLRQLPRVDGALLDTE